MLCMSCLGKKEVNTPIQSKGPNSEADEQNNLWKDALTIFHPVEFFKGFTLLNAQIKTGRTHQIRLHAAQIGFPIVGDTKHGDFAFNRECRKKGFKRMFLHAAEISYQLPNASQRIAVSAPMDDELMVFIEGLDSRKEH